MAKWQNHAKKEKSNKTPLFHTVQPLKWSIPAPEGLACHGVNNTHYHPISDTSISGAMKAA